MRQFARLIEADERPFSRYCCLCASADVEADEGHAAFCVHVQNWAAGSLYVAITDLIYGDSFDLLESQAFISTSAVTNAFGWRVDDVEVQNIWWTDEACMVECEYTASGDQDADRYFYGDTIYGTTTVRIDAEECVTFWEITAEL
jgi:hypothetical protein